MAYKQSYGKQPPQVLEKDHAVVEGIDLPGHWNRMFETRVIGDYDTSTLDQITDLPGGESLGWCYQCGKCVGVCPVDIVGDYGRGRSTATCSGASPSWTTRTSGSAPPA